MSDTSPFGFGKMVPGFDFLQSLVQGASSSMPQMPHLSHWVAPTLSVEELQKRIEELKAVQFWLEQNSRALAATIQALEVQKMTLATLQGMNVSLEEMAKAFQPREDSAVMDSVHKAAQGMATAASWMSGGLRSDSTPPVPPQAAPTSESAAGAGEHSDAEHAAADGRGPAIDPLQWWGALTGQFQQIATHALQDVAEHATKAPASTLAADFAKDAFKTASDMAGQLAAQGLQSFQAARSAAAPEQKSARATASPRKKPSSAARGAAKPSSSKPRGTSRTTTGAAGTASAKVAGRSRSAAKKPAGAAKKAH